MPGTPGTRHLGGALHASPPVRLCHADTPYENRSAVSTPPGSVGAAPYGGSPDRQRGAH
jgi:hypothetical protein